MTNRLDFMSVLGLVVATLLAGCQSDRPSTVARADGPAHAIRANNAANAWLEIDATAFEKNLRTVQVLVGDQVQVCAVLKADAYGHGIALLTPSLVSLGVPYAGITSNSEAGSLRAHGFKGKIMRLRAATLGEVEAALPFDVEELVGNRAVAEAMAGLARSQGRRIRYHLALNSAGMSRNGIELKTPEGRADALALLKLSELHLVGIMTHFPVEDAAEMRKALVVFNADVAWVLREGGLNRSALLVHAANSFATLEVPESRLDLVRVGGALYGDTIPERTEYGRVMAFKSRVAAVNQYPAGNTVSYDRTFTLKRDSRLANLPVGYSDGYRRVFSNQGHVLIRGRRCPIVGRVTMNTIMVDVTDVPEVAAGDEAVLFGRQGDAAITQAELEKSAGTILVDLYTVWGNSNPKILVRP